MKALVTRVDPVEQKISLSIKALTTAAAPDAEELAAQQSRTQRSTLGDLLAEKLRKAGQPDERMTNVRGGRAREGAAAANAWGG